MAFESVILVDNQDNMIGTMEKMAAHRSARLHRAISVFIFNSKGDMLLQKRATHKYHSGGEWSNTCCSHPRPGERPEDAAVRRLQEEMGMQCDLEHAFSFTYRAVLDNGLFEHEYDHVYIGTTDMVPIPNTVEVEELVYLSPDEVERNLVQKPQVFTLWFKICFERVMEHFKIQKNE
ncbi:MAG TPA: isopentenyl-diphosphate Delta-isomerase [Puia sp.]|jgi:isopentenyl-diphosphate delta-isomerase|nr:isopentenyl-diphosphate Delta-isomerase [Puia sp.]